MGADVANADPRRAAAHVPVTPRPTLAAQAPRPVPSAQAPEPTSLAQAPGDQPPAFDVQRLSFRWQAGDSAVLNIDRLRIARGSKVFLVGPSGSGKTSLLNLLAGVVVASSGTVRVLGTALETLSGARRDDFRTRHLGIVFQMFNLVPYLSLVDNVLLPCRFSTARRRRASAAGRSPAAEAERLLTALDLDVAALARRPVVRLSTGQQQRVAVARALIGRPDIILCDEPTSALDAATQRAFLDLLFREVEGAGITLVFASHDLTLASRFDQVVDLPAVSQLAVPRASHR